VSFNPYQFGQHIVVPVLQLLEKAGIPYSETAFNQVMGTIAQESLLGTFLVQNGGPALGIGQLEPNSQITLLNSLTQEEVVVLDMLSNSSSPINNIIGNLPYAVAMVRIYYSKVPEPLPPNTVSGLARYWKQWYNTPAGSGTVQQFIKNFALTGINLPP
jgi:hypothetical protein